MSDIEFKEVARGIITALRPRFDDCRADHIDSEMGGGEFFIAVDDALQAAALARYPAAAAVFRDVDRILADLEPALKDYQRLVRWSTQIPRADMA